MIQELDYCKEMLAKAEKLGKKLLLPVDTVTADAFPGSNRCTRSMLKFMMLANMPADKAGFDIGPKTSELYMQKQ